jgi:glycosyltransferase involved in cell wall biosynthesis
VDEGENIVARRMIVDARGLNRKIDGIGRVMRELFRAMSTVADAPAGVFVAGEGAEWPFEAPKDWLLQGNGYWGGKSATLGWLTKAPTLARRFNCDICFGMTVSALFLPANAKTVVVAHDVIWRIRPEWFSLANRILHNEIVERSIRNADLVIAVSQSTKRDVISILGVPEDRVKVAYLGVTDSLADTELPKPSARVLASGKRMLLCVSSFDPRKNIARLVRACNMLPTSIQSSIELVLVGTPLPYGGEELADEIQKANFSLRITGKVSDKELQSLYSQAYAFIYPSLYEGFGLPVLEAMSNGVPVIAGNNSSLPEVVGNAGILCNVEKVEEIYEHLLRLLEAQEQADSFGELGKKRSSQFTWKEAAEAVAKMVLSL